MSKTSNSVALVGSIAPDFTLTDSEGKEFRLSDQRGKTVVLLFYPGDNTPICTKQLCSVRDRWPDYTATGAEVVGISTDTVESHQGFAEQYKLPLRLLSDPSKSVIGKYGVNSWLPGRAARAVVVVDALGYVRYRKVQPLSLFRPDDERILAAIRAAQTERRSDV
jgi:peroxiredoxin Q/BCP